MQSKTRRWYALGMFQTVHLVMQMRYQIQMPNLWTVGWDSNQTRPWIYSKHEFLSKSELFFFISHRSCWSAISAEIAFTLSAWDPIILQDPPRKESGYCMHPFPAFVCFCSIYLTGIPFLTEINILHRFVSSVSAVKVVAPPNRERLGTRSGHMTSPCVTTAANVSLKVNAEY